MIEIRAHFPDGSQRTLFRHDDEMGMARLANALIGLCGHAKDPEERFQLGLVRDDGKIGTIHCDVGGEIREVQWMDQDKMFETRWTSRDDRAELRERLNRLADSLLLLNDSLRLAPAAIESIRRIIDGEEPKIPLEQGNRTMLDKLRQKYPELMVPLDDYRIEPPVSVDDLAMISVSIKVGGEWRDYRLELVA